MTCSAAAGCVWASACGWNGVEFETLNEDCHNRGARSAEQMWVMRELWTKESVDFHGKYHDITHAGINPLPLQRPIPVWFVVGSALDPNPPETVVRRVARLANGWCPNFAPDETGRRLQARVRDYMTGYGRDPDTLGLYGRLKTAGRTPEDWIEEIGAWQEMWGRLCFGGEPAGWSEDRRRTHRGHAAVQRCGGVLAGYWSVDGHFRVAYPSDQATVRARFARETVLRDLGVRLHVPKIGTTR